VTGCATRLLERATDSCRCPNTASADELLVAVSSAYAPLRASSCETAAVSSKSDWSIQRDRPSRRSNRSACTRLRLPAFAELATCADREFARRARKARQAAAADRPQALEPEGMVRRGFHATARIGSGAIFGEPAPWAPPRRRADCAEGEDVGRRTSRFLGGVGAPAGRERPSKIGSALSPANNDPDLTERSPMPVGVGDTTRTTSAAPGRRQRLADVVARRARRRRPERARLRVGRVPRNALATHAASFPDHWRGRSPSTTLLRLLLDQAGDVRKRPVPRLRRADHRAATWMVMDAVRAHGRHGRRRRGS